MATLTHPAAAQRPATPAADPAAAVAAAAVAVVAAAALLAGWFPIGFSIAIVFLFAGPHNWLEARYFMTRMPARWGRLRWFFTLGIGGVVGLAATMIAIPSIAAALGDGRETWLVLLAAWNSALVLWAAASCPTSRPTSSSRPTHSWRCSITPSGAWPCRCSRWGAGRGGSRACPWREDPPPGVAG